MLPEEVDARLRLEARRRHLSVADKALEIVPD